MAAGVAVEERQLILAKGPVVPSDLHATRCCGTPHLLVKTTLKGRARPPDARVLVVGSCKYQKGPVYRVMLPNVPGFG